MLKEAGPRLDHVLGDATGLTLPAHSSAFTAMGADFLTRAFRRFGVFGEENSITRIARLEPCAGGSTGAKFFLTVEYARPDPALHTDLFLKFSRDFEDDRRDRQRDEMASEVRFIALSRRPGFPIAVPAGYFADYHAASGTGLIVTERIAYGEGGIEPHRRKCMDHEMADPLPCYRAIVTALARLAAAHKAGHLAAVEESFPFDPAWGSADPIRTSPVQLRAELQQCSAFARHAPQLLPAFATDPAFLARMEADALRIHQHETAIQRILTGDPDMIALCHWNAHIDNGWFWREGGELRCGLIDWGRVGQITLGSALWGGLSAAHHTIWTDHLDDLLTLFVEEYATHGGPRLGVAALTDHLTLHMAAMGVARVLAFPEIIAFRLPDYAATSGPLDPTLLAIDPARNCLTVYRNFLHWWHERDFGACLDRVMGGGG